MALVLSRHYTLEPVPARLQGSSSGNLTDDKRPLRAARTVFRLQLAHDSLRSLRRLLIGRSGECAGGRSSFAFGTASLISTFRMGTSATAEDRALHQRLLARDAAASAELFDRYLTRLVCILERTESLAGARGDPTTFVDAATDALFDLVRRPDRYDPQQLRLLAYLRLAAHRDVVNALRGRGRRLAQDGRFVRDVGLSGAAGKDICEAPLEEGLQEEEIWSRIAAILPDATDQRIARLIVEGERRREVYAEILGISHLSAAERTGVVDRAKERVRIRLKRAGRERLLGPDVDEPK